MRNLTLAILALALASTASAGSIRPAACVTSAAQDAGFKDYLRMSNQETCKSLGLPKSCSDIEAKAADPAATIWPITAAGYQASTEPWYCSTVAGQAAAGTAWRTAKQIQDLYSSASPAVQAQVDALLGVAP